MGANSNLGFALSLAKGNDSLAAVIRLTYVAPPGCAVIGAKVIWTLEFVRNACSTSAWWVVIVNFLLKY